MAVSTEVAKPYHYFDTPDGEDVLQKFWCVMKPMIPIASGIAITDVLLVSHPKGYGPHVLRLAAVSLPILGIASTFVLATNAVASLRKKDDLINWFAGGFVAGTGFGLWRRNPMFGFNMGMAGGIAALIRKDMANHGWAIVPREQKVYTWGGYRTCLRDYSLTAERPGNWTTGK